LSQAISLGGLTQAAAAFVVVQGAFNRLVNNYQCVADWRSAVNRLRRFSPPPMTSNAQGRRAA
jgi:ABC-type uncharacterized transport system fused permease/ATPase subunit